MFPGQCLKGELLKMYSTLGLSFRETLRLNWKVEKSLDLEIWTYRTQIRDVGLVVRLLICVCIITGGVLKEQCR